ncbi:metallophosphoesterase [Acinetobacter baumannii]|nr:metallophosphoesterase [Acinetobacter baumannii]
MSNFPYAVISDTHNHNWSAFSETTPENVNSRLQIILNETMRAAEEVKAMGGTHLYHTGDLFHVRGSISPSVLNPTIATYKLIQQLLGIKVRILAGNHDLEFREANRNGSAVTALEGIGCEIINETSLFLDERVAMIPWFQDVNELKSEIERVKLQINSTPSLPPLRSMESVSDWTLMIHAPVDGVIAGIPSHGLSASWLGSQGFKRVFAGHYHHHKDFGNGVYSVGALTHNSWSDINSDAGFLLVNDSKVTWRCSHAPQFVEIDGSMSEVDMALKASGNYVRCTVNSSAKQSDIETIRQFLMDNNAKGVVILSQKKIVEVEREEVSSIKAGASLEVSINDFVNKMGIGSKADDLSKLCLSILEKARMEVVE